MVNRKQPVPLPSEDAVQIAFIAWCRLHRDERQFAFHIPNEGRRSQLGHVIAKRKGLVKGASDNFIPAARGGWNGLVLELKADGKHPTIEQQAFGADMERCGYAFRSADSIDAAMATTQQYMAGQLIRPNWVHYAAAAKA